MSPRTSPLSRRALLRGAGVTLALPFLEAMERRAWAAPTARYVVLFKPNGTNQRTAIPSATGTGYTLPGSWKPLAPLRDQVTIVSGVQNTIAAPQVNLHLGGIGAFLTSVHPSGDRTGISVDQVLAQAWKGSTPLPSIELGGNMTSGEFNRPGGAICEELPCKIAFSLSYSDARTQLPTEMNPQAAFDRLFAGGVPKPTPGGTSPDLAAIRAQKKSVLDFARAQADRLKQRLGASDRARLDGYLTSVRELELRIANLMGPATPATSPASCGTGRPSANGSAQYPARLNAMLDVIALAFQCGVTRVATLMLAEAESEYGFPSIPGMDGGHHSVSHHGGDAGNLAALERIDQFYAGNVAYLAGKLKAMQEAAGSVLDQTIIFHGSEVSDGDSHSYDDMPIVLVGGQALGFPSGRHVRSNGRPLADLHLGIMQTLGVMRPSHGNSTGPLSLT